MQAPNLFAAIAEAAKGSLSDFNSKDVSRTAWAFAKNGVHAPEFFESIAAVVERRVREFDWFDLADTAWAFAKCEAQKNDREATPAASTEALLGIIGEASRRVIEDFTPEKLSILAWSFATARVEAPRLFEAIARVTSKRSGTFLAKDLANMAWAFAEMGILSNTLVFEAIAKEAPRLIEKFNSQDIASLAWAFAKSKVETPLLFEAIAKEVPRRISDFSAQDMTSTTWAFAKAKISAPELFQAIAVETTARIDEFGSQDATSLAWAFATSKIASPKLFSLIASVSRNKVQLFSTQAMANTAWAFATADVPAPSLFRAIAQEALEKIDSFSSQSLADLAWAFACVAWKSKTFFLDLGTALASRLDDLDAAEKAQLYFVALYVTQTWPDLRADKDDSFFALSSFLETLEAAYISCEPTPSQMQRDVSAALDDIGWTHTIEHETPEGLSLQLAQPDAKKALLVIGPEHYLQDPATSDFQLDGAAKFYKKLLENFGWHVFHLPFFTWEKHTSTTQRATMLKAIVDDTTEKNNNLLEEAPARTI